MKKEIENAIREVVGERNKKIVTAQEAVLRELEILRKEVQAQIAEAATEWQMYYLPKRLKSIEKAVDAWRDKVQGMTGTNVREAFSLGQMIVDSPLGVAGEVGFEFPLIPESLIESLESFSVSKIKDVSEAVMVKIETELRLGILGEKDVVDVIKAIGKNLDDPSIFTSIAKRAEAITQHEMGKVFSKAAQERMKQANALIPGGMKKTWIHAGHPMMPRPGHLSLELRDPIGVDLPFEYVNAKGDRVRLMFPRDPGAPLSETMRCGCDSLPYREEWN